MTFISPSSSLTGGRLTPQNPGKLEKVRSLFLQRLHGADTDQDKIMTVLICPCVSVSAAVVGGLFAERLRASGHSGGGLAGVAGGDAPSLCPVLRVGEEMWWLLC